jgi:ADP-heptose:LPS heptosyltransferase
MGTTIFFLPLINKLNEIYPDNTLFFLVFKENSAIIKYLNIVPANNILTIDTMNIFSFSRDLLKHLLYLSKIKVNISIDFEFFSRITAILSYLINSKTRIGFHRYDWEGLYRGDLFTHKVSFNPFIHTVQNYLNLIYALNHERGDVIIKQQIEELSDITLDNLLFSENVKSSIFSKLNNINNNLDGNSQLIIFNPDTSELLPYRKWPEDYFIQLGNRLIDYSKNIFIIITGKEHSEEIGKYISNHIRDRVINLVGKTSLDELFALYSISKVIVSVDSGPVHFASLTDIGIVCIFGPDTPIAFAPLSKNVICMDSNLSCHPCYSVFNNRIALCKDNEKPCLLSVTPDKVFGSVVRMIEF